MSLCPYCRQPMPQTCLRCGEPLERPESPGRGRPRRYCDAPACVAQRRRKTPAQKPWETT